MASVQRESATTPLMSDNDHEASSAQGSCEYAVYESSDSDSVAQHDPSPPAYDTKRDFKDEEAMSDTEPLPEYKPTASEHETVGLLSKDDDQAEGSHKCKRRRCFGRCRRRASAKSDRKRRGCRRIALFIKAVFLFCFVSFFVTKMCLHHSRRGGRVPALAKPPKELLQDAQTSRRIVLDHGSKDISGQYPLYDLLDVETTSGNINLVVDPQPAHPDHPNEPARLIVKTTSGSVSVTFLQQTTQYIVTHANGESERVDSIPADFDHLKASGVTGLMQIQSSIPYRPYEIKIHTTSGAITGTLLFTSTAQLKTASGSISVSFTPVVSLDDPVNVANLVTKSHSGSQSISVNEPLIIDSSESAHSVEDTPSITASHSTGCGSIQVEYPHSWAGNVTALSSGSIAFGGEDLEVTEDGDGHTKAVKRPSSDEQQREWWGSRGDMDVVLESRNSGAIVFHVKDDSYDLSTDATW